ncbi:MAG: hypothetical protein JHC95_21870, partial [Solirubrobacteraceae bacterium]|nr:hypothetical protein [Solirubrobacteraceae bacterium]
GNGGGFGGPPSPSAAGGAGFAPPAMQNGSSPQGGPPGMGGGGMGGSQNTTEALAYARANGGGNVAVSGQNGAGQSIVKGDADDLVAIGGFSGRESQVTTAWLADAIDAGKVRWVLTDGSGGGGMPSDGRVGSTEVMAAVQSTCTAVDAVSGLYDCSGASDALRSAS